MSVRATSEITCALGYVAQVGRIAVLASGSGTNLQAMLDADLPIVVVLADRECGALGVGSAAGVPVELVSAPTSRRPSTGSPTRTTWSTPSVRTTSI